MKTKAKKIDCIGINNGEVKRGSLLFFYALDDHRQVEHVAICTGFDENNIPQLVHAISSYSRNGVQKTDMLSKYGYIVRTPKKPELRDEIANIAHSYARSEEDPQKIPYDEKRMKLIKSKTSNYTAEKQLDLLKTLHESKPLYSVSQVVKTAARESQPIRQAIPACELPKSKKGFTCAHLVAKILQVALLNQYGRYCYKTLEQFGGAIPDSYGVSIAHCNYESLVDITSEDYVNNYKDFLPSEYADKIPYSGLLPVFCLLGPNFNTIETNYYKILSILEKAPFVAKWMTAAALLEYTEGGSGGGGIGFYSYIIDRTRPDISIEHTIKKKIIVNSTLNATDHSQTNAYKQMVEKVLNRAVVAKRLPEISILIRQPAKRKPEYNSSSRNIRCRG